MKNLKKVYSGSANTSLKNNRNLNKRSGFFESYKKSDRKFNLKSQKNENVKEMNKSEILLLREKLNTQYWLNLVGYVVGIGLLTGLVFFLLNQFV